MKKIPYKKKYNNIIFFCPTIGEGGVEKNLVTISNYFVKKGINTYLITANKNKKKEFINKIKFVVPKSNFWDNKIIFLKNLVCAYLLIKNFYNKDFKLISFKSNILALILVKLLNKKIVIRSNNSPDAFSKNFIRTIIFKFFFKLADKVVVNSLDFKNLFFKKFNIKPVMIYNPTFNKKIIIRKSKEKINFNFFDNIRELKIISVGRLVKQKNHILLLNALNNLKNKIKFKCVVIGKGNEYKFLKNFIKIKKLENKIKLLGYKKNPLPYILKSDVFILTSIYEGLPNVLIDAVALSKKIISSNCETGPKEILLDGKAGYLFKNNSQKNLEKKILLMINSYKKNKQKIYLGKKYLHRFDENLNCKKYLELMITL